MDDFHIEEYRMPCETDKHWALRKDFIQTYKGDFPDERLRCLSQIYADIELHEWSHPPLIVHDVQRFSKTSEVERTLDDHKEGVPELLRKEHEKESTKPGNSSGTASQKRSSSEAIGMNSQESDPASSRTSAKKSRTSKPTVPSDSCVNISFSVGTVKKKNLFSGSKKILSSRNSYHDSINDDEVRKYPSLNVPDLEMASLESCDGQERLKLHTMSESLGVEKSLMQNSDAVIFKNWCNLEFQLDTLSKKLNNEKIHSSPQAIIQKSDAVFFGILANQEVLQSDMLPKSVKDETQNSLPAVLQKSDHLFSECSNVSEVHQVGTLPDSLKDETRENFLQSVLQKSGTTSIKDTGGQGSLQFNTVSESLDAGTQHSPSQTVIQKPVMSARDPFKPKFFKWYTLRQSSNNEKQNSVQENSDNGGKSRQKKKRKKKKGQKSFKSAAQKLERVHLENFFFCLPESLKSKFVHVYEFMKRSFARKLNAIEVLSDVSEKLKMKVKFNLKSISAQNPRRKAYECSLQIDSVLISKVPGKSPLRAGWNAIRVGIDNLKKFSEGRRDLNLQKCSNDSCQKDFFFFRETMQNSSESTAENLEMVQLENFCSMDTLPENLKSNFTEISEFIKKSLSKNVNPIKILKDMASQFKIELEINLELILNVQKHLVCECSVQIDGTLISKAESNSGGQARCDAAQLAIDKLMAFPIRIGNIYVSSVKGVNQKK